VTVFDVAIAGSRDRQLEELVRAAGMRPTVISLAELSSLGSTSKAPACVLLDVRGGRGIPTELASAKRHNPGLGVAIIATGLEPALLLEAMRAGVNEVVAEPITQADIERAVGNITNGDRHAETGQIFGFVGAKGGVGTTTVAVNVAIALAAVEKSRVLLIDMQQGGGDAAVFMGIEPRHSVMDAVENTHRLDESFFKGLVMKAAPGLDLLASPDQPFTGAVDPARFRQVLDFVTGSYKYVVLDLRRVDTAVIDALDRVTAIFIVANQELATVKSGSRIANTLRQRYGSDRIKTVLTRSDRQADIGMADVERAIGVEVMHTFPSDYRVALQALNSGRPLALRRETELAESFFVFADRLAGRHRGARAHVAAPRAGFLSRLTPRRA
jgi:pilus assembly protein CpaE